LAELGRLVATMPDNTEYRLQYAIALMIAGENEAATQQAELLGAFPTNDHSFHFNLGQLFWFTGDSKQGREHLKLALAYAKDDDERRDVHERIAYLEGRQ